VRLAPAWGVVVACVLAAASAARAQDIEPRAYSNAPVGVNFAIAGYVQTRGGLEFPSATQLTNAKINTSSALFAYARVLDLWGMSGKFDAILPYMDLSGTALYKGDAIERNVDGQLDPRFRLSVNFYGAPALGLKDFRHYQQDIIVGTSLQVGVPLGQYDPSRLVNLGNNRWSFKPELGISKAWGPWTVEVAPSVTIYTDNTDFNRGGRLEQAPLYAVQGHVIYGFASGTWVAFNGTYFNGNRTTVNGVRSNNMQANTRAGITLALPVDRSNSVKLHASSGASTRTGTEFTAFAVAWQYRWGGGF